jgi:hypothetical protein
MGVYTCVCCGKQDYQTREYNGSSYLCRQCFNKNHNDKIILVERVCKNCHKKEKTKLIDCPADMYVCRACWNKENRMETIKQEEEFHSINTQEFPTIIQQPVQYPMISPLPIEQMFQMKSFFENEIMKLRSENKELREQLSNLQNVQSTKIVPENQVVQTVQYLNTRLSNEIKILKAKLSEVDDLKKENEILKKKNEIIPSLQRQIEELSRKNALIEFEYEETINIRMEKDKIKLSLEKLKKELEEKNEIIHILEFRSKRK